MGRAGGRGEGGGCGAIEAVADPEAIAGELVNTGNRAASVGAPGAEENERSGRLGVGA